MSNNDWKSKLVVAYPTSPDFDYDSEPDSEQENVPEGYPKHKQPIRIALDKRQRRGKQVTIVADFKGSENDLKELGRMLKTKCGVGGSAKDGEIIIQGDFREKIKQILVDNGYTKTKVI